VLVMAYGTPRGLEDVPRYYTHIRHGRAPSPEELRDLEERYRAIGGRSPLHEITLRQAAGIERALNGGERGPYRVYLGHKHTAPFIEDAVDRLLQDRPGKAAALVLAPHFSRASIGEYFERVRARLAQGGPEVSYIDSWCTEPRFVEFMADRVRDALGRFADAERDDVRVVFSAHSLPLQALKGDPYPDELHRSGDLIAREAGLRHWLYGWQSAGAAGGEWMGPDIRDVIKDLRAEGHARILVCPVGFVADHLEVLYDIDIEAQQLARDLDVELVRTASPNDDERFTSLLAEVVRSRLHPAS